MMPMLMAASDESICPEVSIQASICSSFPTTCTGSWNSLDHSPNAFDSRKASTSKRIEETDSPEQDLAGGIVATRHTSWNAESASHSHQITQVVYTLHDNSIFHSSHEASGSSALRPSGLFSHHRPRSSPHINEYNNMDEKSDFAARNEAPAYDRLMRHSPMYTVRFVAI